MESLKFKECNIEIARDQPEYKSIHAWKDDSGTVVMCYKMSFKEKLRALFLGKIWLTRLTFNQDFQPMKISTQKKDHLTTIQI